MDPFIAAKSSVPVFKEHQPDDSQKFQELPEPTGTYPFRLDLEKVMPDLSKQKMVFHMVGDTGSVRNPDFQKLVADRMTSQYLKAGTNEDQPKFLYHLGDIVYNFGEAFRYDAQFFEPYQKYPCPVFAIPGNHDSDVNPDSEISYKSLDAFRAVFCDTESRHIGFDSGSKRKSLVQPNVFWTLETPLANIIGLYSNVPKYGIITAEQKAWFANELVHANEYRPERAVIVCLHHSPYSADFNHSSSLQMIAFLESAFDETGIRPDIVFSGHVHNYQRFEKWYPDGTTLPFIVAGGGGYDELHSLVLETDPGYTNDSIRLKNIRLINYCDDQHGFLKITIEKEIEGLSLTGEYHTVLPEPIDDPETPASDVFKVFIR